jgi:hypothetical protein
MRYSSRFWLYAPLAAFAALMAGIMVHWWFAAGAFENRLATLKGREAVPGITLNWKNVTVGGFPFRLDANFTDFSAGGEAAHGPFEWRSQHVAIHSLTYGKGQDVLEAAGVQNLKWTDASGDAREIAFLPGLMRGSASHDAQGLSRFDLDIKQLSAEKITAGRFQFHMRRDPDGRSLDLMLRADDIKRGESHTPLVQVYATLDKGDVIAPLLAGKAHWRKTVSDWRKAGGAAKLTQITAPDMAADAILSPLY